MTKRKQTETAEGKSLRETLEKVRSAADWLDRIATKVTDEACRKYAPVGIGAMYVYFRRGDVIAVYDYAGEKEPPGYELAFNERLPMHLSRDQIRAWIHDRLRRVPCLPEEE